jgi:hypothetical protein
MVQELRTRYNTKITRAALGEPKRQAGGLTLRATETGTTPATAV